jgi:hypothetical protein
MDGEANKNREGADARHDCEFRDMLGRIGDQWRLLVILILEGMSVCVGASRI